MAGRPLKFKTVEELQSLIDRYFQETLQDEWTITGLALALDTSRETLVNYEAREPYFDAIKKAKEMVHNSYELDLRRKGRSADIFALKNFGWSDKQETDITTKGDKIVYIPSEIAIKNNLNATNNNPEPDSQRPA